MLLPLLLLLLAVLFSGGDNREAYQGPTSFHVMQTSSFANSTWTLNRGSGWLEDLQIHGWDSDTGTAIFLKPWSKGNLTDEEVTELEEIFRVYFFGITKEVQERISDLQLECESSPQNWGHPVPCLPACFSAPLVPPPPPFFTQLHAHTSLEQAPCPSPLLHKL
ncbi:T-cell surface glycoprotein CD1b-like [Ictidomys tridecemlineatus]